jgi:hypothetical protein
MRPGHETLTHNFSCLSGPGAVSKTTCWDTLHKTCVFASDAIFGSRIAFPCVRGVSRRSTMFNAWVGLLPLPQKACRDMLRRTCAFVHGLGTESTEYLDMSFGGVFVHCRVKVGKLILDRILSITLLEDLQLKAPHISEEEPIITYPDALEV